MNKAGIVVLILGFVVLFIGAGIAISAQSEADSADLYQRYMYPDWYEQKVTEASIGWTAAGVGVLLVAVGLVIAVATGRKESVQYVDLSAQSQHGPPINSNSARFCTYCGQPIAQGGSFCAHCGGKLQTSGQSNASDSNQVQRQCPRCGEKVPKGAYSCRRCGLRFE